MSYFKTQESALPKNHNCQVTWRLSNEPPSKKPKLDIGIDSESVSDTEDETMSSQTSQTSGEDIHLNSSDDDNEADKLTGSIDCPECRKSMANLSQLYMHLRVCHDRSKWLHFRTKKVPGIQEYQCPKCYFYFSNERAHSCDKYKSILFKPRDEPDAGNEHLKADTHSICPFHRTKVQGYNEHCQVCGFYFPTEEEYYDHFGFCQDYALAGTTSGGNKRRPKRSVQTKVNFAENSDSDPEPKRPKSITY